MNCPTCGGPVADGDAFCGNCGAPIAAAQPTQPMPQPTPPAPAPQPTQVMPAAAPAAPAPQGQNYGYQQPAAAAPGKKTGLIVALAIVGTLAVVGVLAGGFFAFRALTAEEPETPQVTETSSPTTAEEPVSSSAEPVGAASAEEALAAEIPSDWVFAVDSDTGDVIEYIIGPPNSEYVEVVVVARQPDGSWLVESTRALEGDLAGDAMTPEDQAIQVVGEFIYAVQEDRADDAHTLTISPFAEDPASAMYSNGDLSSFELTDAQLQGDGTTVWVWSSESWAWGNESYIYVCVPTADGYRISDLRIP